MNTIYKYPIAITDHQFIETYKDAHILSVKMQREVPYIWIAVDTKKPKTKLEIGIYGTGNPIPVDVCTMSFIDTIIEKQFVWHVFQLTE